MQFAKDTFYMALRERLATQFPQRTITLEGTAQPAILVAENETTTAAPDCANCFYLHFGAAKSAHGFEHSARPLMALACTISYRTTGTVEGGGDRGRMIGALDRELMSICEPASTPKLDYTQATPAALGTRVFWTRALPEELTENAGEVSRTATATIFFYPEEAA